MEGFDTINLDTNICDICNQDTGEDLINCILNDRCLQVGDSSSSNFDVPEPFKQAHKQCLDRWKSVVQSTLYPRCPSPKRSWRDKLKDLLNRNVESTSIFDAWVEVDSAKSSSKSSTIDSISPSQHSVKIPKTKNFLNKEEYRVEKVNDDFEECLDRGRKLRVRSIDIEDEDEDEEYSSNSLNPICHNNQRHGSSWTLEQLRDLKHVEVVELHDQIKQRIKETSSLLITELEEKDALKQQADSLHTTVAQLVQLQQKQKIKTLSVGFDQQHHLVS